MSIFRALSQATPLWLARRILPNLEGLLRFQSLLYQRSVGDTGKSPVPSDKTILSSLGDASVPPEERTPERFQDEGVQLLIAGTEATARPTAIALFHLSKDRTRLSKLRSELKRAMPSERSSITPNELMKLPYLSGVANEALRLAHGPIGRMPRIAPAEAVRCKNHLIPPGVCRILIEGLNLHADHHIPDPYEPICVLRTYEP
ncbi:cytochrome P450 [Aspergillus lucknowensis]|uniref:Cytochrome P450 n=1 Tax=Aspergillus lucknowensis TaxID=176173 RepID=A0ABR4M3Q2_9EURO